MDILRASSSPQTSGSRSPLPGSLRVGAIYLVVGVLWIVLTDWALRVWIADPAQIASLQTVMGAVFVSLSAIVVSALVYRELRSRTESEQRTRLLADQDVAGITVVGEDLQFRFVNRRLADLFGYEPDELVNSSIRVSDLTAPEDREMVAEELSRRLEGDLEEVRFQFTGITKDEEKIRVKVHGRRIEWEGEPAVMSLQIDVTEEERLREQARHAQRMESLGQLTGAVAHDFNNLLTAIMAPIDLSEDYLEEDHPVREELKVAMDSARSAQALTRQLLSFSRRRIYQPRPTDLNEFVRSLHPMLETLTDAGVEVRMELEAELPAVEIDRHHFEQVLLNLLTNAHEAVGRKGEIRIQTRLEARQGGIPPDVVLEVIDNGTGMDEETRQKIFEPFFTTRKQGTGLGLSTVHGIVMQVGGRISVDSAPGEGATFRIRLPASSEEAEAAEEPRTPKQERSGKLGKDVTILIVDDNDAVLRVTERALQRHGFGTLSEPDGNSAIARLDEYRSRIDLVLIDVELSDMNGVEMAARMRDMLPSVRVVYMSGHSDEEVVDRLARERSAGFLEKPFSVDELVDQVHTALRPDRNHDDNGANVAS